MGAAGVCTGAPAYAFASWAKLVFVARLHAAGAKVGWIAPFVVLVTPGTVRPDCPMFSRPVDTFPIVAHAVARLSLIRRLAVNPPHIPESSRVSPMASSRHWSVTGQRAQTLIAGALSVSDIRPLVSAYPTKKMFGSQLKQAAWRRQELEVIMRNQRTRCDRHALLPTQTTLVT